MVLQGILRRLSRVVEGNIVYDVSLILKKIKNGKRRYDKR